MGKQCLFLMAPKSLSEETDATANSIIENPISLDVYGLLKGLHQIGKFWYFHQLIYESFEIVCAIENFLSSHTFLYFTKTQSSCNVSLSK